MSIAILKRKAIHGGQSRESPISGISPLGFSINGTRRNSGQVGPTNLAPKGNANSAGQHSGISCCMNDTLIIKRSVKNTKGMLSVRYNFCRDGNKSNCPKEVVQVTERTQTEYIHKKHALTAQCNFKTLHSECHNNCKQKFIGGKNVFKGNYTKSPIGAVSQTEYLKGKYLVDNAYLYPACTKTKIHNCCYPAYPPMTNNSPCH